MEYININGDMTGKTPPVAADLPGNRSCITEASGGAEKSSHVSYESLTGYRYDRKKDEAGSATIMNNFEEYIREKNEKTREEGLDEESKREQEKEAAEEIARTISSDEIHQLELMGIDITSAKFTHIMGIVNSLRLREHRNEIADIVSGRGADDKNIKACDGGDGYIRKEEVTENDSLPESEDNKTSTNVLTDNENKDSFVVTENELVYIIRNGEPLSAESLYKAHFSGNVSNTENISAELFEKVRPQLEKVLYQAGFSENPKASEGAEFLLRNELPVTTDNIRFYMEYNDRCADKSISDIDFNSIGERDYAAMGEELSREIGAIKPDMVDYIVRDNREVTIAALREYTEKYGKYDYRLPTETADDLKTITAKRQLEEIRLAMTSKAAAGLLKWDINIDTRELSKVVSSLRKLEEMTIKNTLESEGIEPSKDNISLYEEVSNKIQSIGQLHAGAAAAPLGGEEFTVNALYRWDTRVKTAQAEFGRAIEEYEKVGTAPRKDLGDSIKKAFGNIGDILSEMELPVSEENERAVRILAYNSMEITPQNIDKIVDYDRQITQLMDTFYPESVLSLIKDGINPLDMPIDELNNVIMSANYNKGITEAENFAAYLRDMEKQGLVSPEERESYIGLFRVMDKLAKSGDREAGYLFATGQKLTIRNVISAMRSEKAAGLDVSIDEQFGFLTQLGKKGKDMEAQIESGFEKEQAEDKALYLRTAAEADPQVWEFIEAQGIAATGVNLRAVENMLKSRGGIYDLLYDVIKELRFKIKGKEEQLDRELENITDSLTGDEITLPFAPESILESLTGSEEMSLKYDDLRDRLMELMYSGGINGTLSSMDISAIKTASAGLGIMSTQARCSKFYIPVSTGDGMKIVNLSVKEGGKESGLIELSMDGGVYGRISAVIKVKGSASTDLEGYVTADTEEGNYYLDRMTDRLGEAFSDNGYEIANISMGKMPVYKNEDTDTAEGNERIENKKLYNLSVALIKAIASGMDEA